MVFILFSSLVYWKDILYLCISLKLHLPDLNKKLVIVFKLSANNHGASMKHFCSTCTGKLSCKKSLLNAFLQVKNVAFAFELMDESSVPYPRCTPEGKVKSHSSVCDYDCYYTVSNSIGNPGRRSVLFSFYRCDVCIIIITLG